MSTLTKFSAIAKSTLARSAAEGEGLSWRRDSLADTILATAPEILRRGAAKDRV